MRPSGRKLDEMRTVSIEAGVMKHAEGSCLIKMGDTHVLCSALGERQIVVDCDVIQADGGTRCASITGGWVALRLAVNKLMKAGVIVSDPMIDHVAAVSCGVYAGQEVLDLDYAEDSVAGTDGNFVITGRGRMIEVQMSAEGATFSRDEMGKLLDLAEAGVAALVAAQKAAVA